MNVFTRIFKFLQNRDFKIITNSWSGIDVHEKNQWYSDYSYEIMEHDEIRKQTYQNVIRDKVKGKVVVEVGTGRSIFLTKMCIDHGAVMVFTIEENKKAFESSKELIRKLGLHHQIKIHHGFSFDVQLDKKGDVFLHEIVGMIAGDEGMVQVANDAKNRFLKPDAEFIPYRCSTMICPVSSVKISSKEKIINYMLAGIDLASSTRFLDSSGGIQRNNTYAMYNFPLDHLIGKPEIFEDIIFNTPLISKSEKLIQWDISEQACFDGFVLFIKVFVDENHVLNSIEQKLNWPVVYVKLSSKDIRLQKGDRVTANIYTDVSTQIPVYSISTCITRNNSVIFQKDNFSIR